MPTDDAASLRVDPEAVAPARVRIRLDWPTFLYIVLAVLGFLAVIAVFDATSTMLTRIGIGLVIALALDPVVDAIQRRFSVRRGIAVAVVAVMVFGLAALLIAVLGPRAAREAQKFSEQLPDTVDQLEDLPLVGGYLRENRFGEEVQDWVRRLPEQFTDERIAEIARQLASGVASVAIVSVLVIAVLIDGENLLGRFRRLLPEARREQADAVGGVLYRTLGRYFGGSVTVAILMGLDVLALGLLLGIPLAPMAAIWAMLTNLIPQVGGFLGGSFLVLLASTQGVGTALIAAAAFIVYMSLDNHLITPTIVGKSVDLAAPTTMVAAFIGGSVAGIPGALVATPIVGAVKAIYLEARGDSRAEEHVGIGERFRRLLRRKKR